MFIVIEGVDASGKETQTKLLCEKFTDSVHIEFPDYESNSSALVKMYLAGDFGKSADDVSPYTASVFFACDRFASYKTKWSKALEEGKTVIADRYVSSNLIHQSCKITEAKEKENFISWLENFEYNIMGVPKPDFTLFLDMPPEFAAKLIKKRNNKITGNSEKDIHESDSEYLINAYNNAVSLAKKMNWHIIKCVKDKRIKSPREISEEVYSAVKTFMKG